MIWMLCTSAGVAALFIWLYARAVAKNGKLEKENEALQAQANVKNEQIGIAAGRSLDPDAIIDQLRRGGL